MPPETVTCALPLQEPLSTVEDLTIERAGGSVMFTEAVAELPQESVTVTLYVPAVSPLIVPVVLAFDHA